MVNGVEAAVIKPNDSQLLHTIIRTTTTGGTT
jgi:hypothetical protein